MIILHYIPSIDRSSGGIGSYMQLLAKELGKIVELHVATHQSAHPLDLENCVVHPIAKWKHWPQMKKDWCQLLDELHPDVVHCNCCWEPGSPMAQRWAQERGFKVVLSPHGMLEPWILKRHHYTRKLPALWLYQRKAISQADCIHATAESEKEHLLQLGWNNKITVVPNGVAVEFISMKSSWKRTNNILFLSRVHPKKGLNFLIEALAQLKGDYQCTIAGEGEFGYINELKALATKLRIADRVTFVGGVYGNTKWKLFQESDVFVLPTHSENFGIVVAEALASGTPVITTQGTPWQELDRFHCGWWTEIGTQPLLDALRSFSNCTEDELKVMGQNGRKLIEQKYSTIAEAEAMVKLYQQLLSQM
ncbi:MAG TPA: glycosyl transferase [Prevotella sp.]|nr:glycosyl transferase [Prevotella sp.]